MKRLPIANASLVGLELGEDELKRVVGEIGAAAVFDDSGIRDLSLKLAAIHGRWWAELAAKEVSPVVKALGNVACELTKVTALLSGHETGIQPAAIAETMSQIVRALARDPTVGSIAAAQRLIDGFRGDAAKIREACLTAFADLSSPSPKKGRDAFSWYDDFTALLTELAKELGIQPTLRKDRVTGERSGWLFDTAQALERFFPPYMRSQSPEACGKRLERSRKRLMNAHRQIRGSD